MGQTTSSTINPNDSQHAYNQRQTNDHEGDVPQHVEMTQLEESHHQQQQQVYLRQQIFIQKMRKRAQTIGTSSSSPSPELSTPASHTSHLNLTPTATAATTHKHQEKKIKRPGHLYLIPRPKVIMTIQNELLQDSTMTFTQQDIQKQRVAEMKYQRHQTKKTSPLDQDNYICATLAYVELKQLTLSVSRPMIERYPGSTFAKLPELVKDQLILTLNHQAIIKYRLFIDKCESNWMANHFFYGCFRSHYEEFKKQQQKKREQRRRHME